MLLLIIHTGTLMILQSKREQVIDYRLASFQSQHMKIPAS
jgi:hypothetical protein